MFGGSWCCLALVFIKVPVKNKKIWILNKCYQKDSQSNEKMSKRNMTDYWYIDW